jgi:methionyl-tRNA formyltransferase
MTTTTQKLTATVRPTAQFARRRTPSPDRRARVVFLGSGAFAVPILEALIDDPEIDVVGVVSAPDRPVGRGAAVQAVPVAAAAGEHHLPLLQPARLRAPEAIADVARLQPDLGVLADYGQIVPAALLDAIPHGMLNLHPSLLPRHRGATPVPAAILAGDGQTGVTLFRMDPGLDTGPVVAASTVALDGAESGPSLEARLATVAAQLLARSIGPWLRGELPARPQAAEGITLSRPLRRADGRLDPARSAAELERQVRAYLGWPGSFLETNAERIVVLQASVGPGTDDPPGTLVADGPGVALTTPDGTLVLDRVQPAGGRPMTGAELRRGRPGLAGTSAAAPAGR